MGVGVGETVLPEYPGLAVYRLPSVAHLCQTCFSLSILLYWTLTNQTCLKNNNKREKEYSNENMIGNLKPYYKATFILDRKSPC